MKTVRLACLIGFAALPMLASAAPNPPAKTGPCDRACLQGFVDKYLDAMQAHKVSDDLFARDVRFTENGIRLPFGHEGLWYDMSGKGQYRFYVPDVEIQQVAFIGTVRFGGKTTTDGTLAAIALRLRIVDNRITEVEQLDIRPDNTQQVNGGARANSNTPAAAPPRRFPPTGEAVDRLGKPADVYFQTIPEDKRPTREELIKTANYYFAGLQRNDGKGYYPFTDDCLRLENGIQTTKPEPGACKRQFQNDLKGVVSRVRDRRFVAVDRERGIVFAFAFFDHYRINWTWQLAELFKIQDGQIRRIEAVFQRAPFGIPSGWSTYQQGMSEEPQDIR
jgi:hypothetical protein